MLTKWTSTLVGGCLAIVISGCGSLGFLSSDDGQPTGRAGQVAAKAINVASQIGGEDGVVLVAVSRRTIQQFNDIGQAVAVAIVEFVGAHVYGSTDDARLTVDVSLAFIRYEFWIAGVDARRGYTSTTRPSIEQPLRTTSPSP